MFDTFEIEGGSGLLSERKWRLSRVSAIQERHEALRRDRHTCYGGGKGSAPPPPDYGPIAASNAEAARIAKESADADLAFRKEVYADNKPRQEGLYNLAQQVAQTQLGAMESQSRIADEANDYWKGTYQPVERQTVMDSMGSRYLSGTDREMLSKIVTGTSGLSGEALTRELDRLAELSSNGAAQEAQTMAQAQTNSAFAQQARQLTRSGFNPNRIMGAAAQLAQQQALTGAGAANNARRAAMDKYTGLRTGVANFGRNMPNTALQSGALANQSGNSAVNNANTGLMSGLPYAQYQSGGYAGQANAAMLRQQGALGLGGLMNQGYNTQVSAWNAANQAEAGGLAGLGQLAGSLGSAYLYSGSDRSIKENIHLVGQRADGLKLYMFEYKEPYRDLWGHGRHLGVMADEVERIYPHAVAMHADGYKMVDYGQLG